MFGIDPYPHSETNRLICSSSAAPTSLCREFAANGAAFILAWNTHQKKTKNLQSTTDSINFMKLEVSDCKEKPQPLHAIASFGLYPPNSWKCIRHNKNITPQ